MTRVSEPKISQVQAARIMYAAEKWAKAQHERTFRFMRHGMYSDESKQASAGLDDAKQAFADLIAQLVEEEP